MVSPALAAVLVLAVLRPVTSLASVQSKTVATSPSFEQYVELHGRNYAPGSEEYSGRASLYARAAEAVDSHNEDPSRSWTASVGKFADYTAEERLGLHGLLHGEPGEIATETVDGGMAVNLAARSAEFPKFFSWSHLRSMRQVKNQGACGSCWAASALKALEAHYEIATNKTKTFSVQHLVSCAENPKHCGGTGGCHGATSDIAFQYILEHGILTEDQYPYMHRSEKCPSALEAGSMRAADLGMLRWERLPENEYDPIVRTLVEVGPLVISVAASSGFADYGISVYQQGIYNGCKEDAVLNHAMVLFGYGQSLQGSSSQGYWQLQNSWGKDWGERGTMRMLRKIQNGPKEEEFYCGVDREPLKGSGCPGGPEIKVCGSCGILFKGTFPHISATKGEPQSVQQRRWFR